jgi:hypothetical protein
MAEKQQTTEEPQAKNLHQRLLAITNEASVTKDGTAPEKVGGFAFHRIDDVESALCPLFVRHGVLATVDVPEMETTAQTQTNGKIAFVSTAKVEVTFANADDPEDALSVTNWGRGVDYSDKGPGKAVSYGCKSLYLSFFHLKGQHDVEAEANGDGNGGQAQASAQTQAAPPASPPPEHQAPAPEGTWPIGKHKGTPLELLTDNYLEWAVSNLQNEDHRDLAMKELERRGVMPPPQDPERPEDDYPF